VLVWETHVAYQHPKAAKLGSPISSTVTTYFCTMSLKCLTIRERGHLAWAPTPRILPLIFAHGAPVSPHFFRLDSRVVAESARPLLVPSCCNHRPGTPSGSHQHPSA
jgi:hypothetical protein